MKGVRERCTSWVRQRGNREYPAKNDGSSEEQRSCQTLKSVVCPHANSRSGALAAKQDPQRERIKP
jgi:hypothetical protein